ncbi:MAG: FtsX-like permease family protein [Cyclobacteriaceae bacterium]
MFHLFFQSTLRQFRKNMSYTLINVIGLAVGIAFSILTYSVVSYELSFDQHHDDADRILRINTVSVRQSERREMPATPFPLVPALLEGVPEVEKATRVWFENNLSVEIMDGDVPRKFIEERNSAIVDKAFLEIFNVPLLEGSAEVLDEPNTVILSERLAQKYFNTDDPSIILGQRLTISSEREVTVAGIMPNPPSTTDFPFDLIYSIKTIESDPEINIWHRIEFALQTYVKLQPGATGATLNEKLPPIIEQQAGERFAQFMQNDVQPLAELHFDTEVGGFNRTISKSTIYMLAIIGLVMLLTACINFVNLASAQAMQRSREVGIKKVLGSSKRGLILNYLGETFLITAFSAFLACGVAYMAYPLMTEILGYEPPFDLTSPEILAFLVSATVFTVFFSGLYPAFLMAGFKPLEAVRNNLSRKIGGGLWLRRSLVVLQFGVSQTLIICTLVVNSQLDFFLSSDLGFDKDALITIALPETQTDKYERFTNQLAAMRGVSNFSVGNAAASSGSIWMQGYSFEGSIEDEQYVSHSKYGDENYIETFGMELLAGRSYRQSDTVREVVINELMMNEMGITDPVVAIQKSVNLGGTEIPIIGVVSDFNTVSLREPIQACFIGMEKANFYEVFVKLGAENRESTLSALEGAWTSAFPNDPFEYEYLDEQLAQNYEAEDRLSQLFTVFAVIAIFIGCLGLFGMISYMVNQKLKEVGIRKVLGASISNVVGLFSTEFVKLLVVAFLIAAPLAYYYMNEWLTEFAFRIALGPGIFLIALIVSLVIALATVGYRAFRAATVNPVLTLRNE